MKNIKLTILGIVTLLFALTLNFRHALNDYGILDNKLHVEVLAQNNSGGVGDSSGAGIGNEEECRSNNGYWNMALVLQSSGVTPITCEKRGELKIWNFILVGYDYLPGHIHYVAWESFSCVASSGNCCIASSQGIHILGSNGSGT